MTQFKLNSQEISTIDFDAPRSAQRQLTVIAGLGGAVSLILGIWVITHHAIAWPIHPAFTWAYSLTFLITGPVITALLYYQTLIVRSRAISVLMGVSWYSALLHIVFFLVFPDAIVDGELLGGSQSSIWTNQMWHVGMLLGLSFAALLLIGKPKSPPKTHVWTICSLLVATIATSVVAYFVIARADSLPVLIHRGAEVPMTAQFHQMARVIYVLVAIMFALSLLAARTQSRLRVWLVLFSSIMVTETLTQQLRNDRYSDLWYLGRMFAMAGFTVLLLLLLSETLRQAQELAARRVESSRLSQLIEASQLGQYGIDTERNVIDLNPAFTKLTGFTREELIGKELPLSKDPEADAMADELLDRLQHREMDSVSLRLQFPRKNGIPFWADFFAHTLVDANGDVIGSVGSLSDASGVMSAELDPQAPVGTMIIGRDDCVTNINKAFEHMMNQLQEHVLNQPLTTFIAADDANRISQILNDLHTGKLKNITAEFRIVVKDKSPMWVSTYWTRLVSTTGEYRGATIQFIDVNEQKLAELAADKAQDLLEFRATHDTLTGLLNRQSFITSTDQMLNALQPHQSLMVAILNIDAFQQVSNLVTRTEGDQVITDVGYLIRDEIDKIGITARPGGDEFTIAVHLAEGAEPEAILESIKSHTKDRLFGTSAHHIHLTLCAGYSIGVEGSNASNLLQEADLALREAKRAGHGTTKEFDQALRSNLRAEVTVANAIRDGLVKHEFEPWYQPLVTLSDRKLCGYEALARWRTPEGIKLPSEFLAMSQPNELITKLGNELLDQVVKQLLTLPPDIRVGFNTSPVQLLRGNFYEQVSMVLKEYGVAPERLIVEITEQSLFESNRAKDANLFKLADLGVGIHVDDFGTGYSSLTHLRDFPVTGVKLDQSFTAGITSGHERSIELAEILGGLVNKLKLEGVAEGVETEEQAKKLLEFGWHIGQGWLFGKAAEVPGQPLPRTDVHNTHGWL